MNTINKVSTKINDVSSGLYNSIYDSIYTNNQEVYNQDINTQEEIEIDDMNEDEWLDYVIGGERVVEPYKDRLDSDNKKRLDMGNRLGMSDTTMKILSKEGYDRIRVSDLCVVGEDKYRLTLLHGGVIQVEGIELERYDLRGVEDTFFSNNRLVDSSIYDMEVSY